MTSYIIVQCSFTGFDITIKLLVKFYPFLYKASFCIMKIDHFRAQAIAHLISFFKNYKVNQALIFIHKSKIKHKLRPNSGFKPGLKILSLYEISVDMLRKVTKIPA